MPLLLPYGYGRALAYQYQAQRNHRPSHEVAPLMAQKAKPLTDTQKLELLGVPKKHADDILNHLEGDQPYHAGKLINGNVYLLTQNDNVYYGKPNNLQKLEGVQAHRTKCIDQQVRKYHTPDGLSFTVSYQKGQGYSASATTKFLCLNVPMLHSRETHFFRPKAQRSVG